MRKREKARSGAKKRRRMASGKKALIWLALMSVALIAVLVCPSPYKHEKGGVELYGDDPEAEVYGPELPETIVGGYTAPSIESVVLPEDGSSDEDTTLYVYASEDQKNYHLSTCRYAYASAKKLTLYEAYYLGYTPGKCCGAPEYTGN